jgi:hypothetical protein
MVWVGAGVVLLAAGLLAAQHVHDLGMEGSGYVVFGSGPWAVVAGVPLLVLAALLRNRLPRVALALIVVASLLLIVTAVLDFTGLSWILGPGR